jgi:hypothetical protein
MWQYDAAQAAIKKLEEAGAKLSAAIAGQSATDLDTALVRQDALARMMKQENPVTGKPWTITAAENAVGTDSTYRAHKLESSVAFLNRTKAQIAYDCAKLQAKLAIAKYDGAPKPAEPEQPSELEQQLIASLEATKPRCGDECAPVGWDAPVQCELPAGHEGAHYQKDAGRWLGGRQP